jgi:hypothetical protein
MSIEENLYYPLIVLAAGSLISAYLIPKISGKYQDKQKEIDRAREDRRYALEVKKEILMSIGKVHRIPIALSWVKFGFDETRKISKEETQITVDKFIKEGLIPERLILLYFGEHKNIIEEWDKFMKMSIESIKELGKDPLDDKKSRKMLDDLDMYLNKCEKEIKKTKPAFIG